MYLKQARGDSLSGKACFGPRIFSPPSINYFFEHGKAPNENVLYINCHGR